MSGDGAEDVDGTYGGMSFIDGVATFTLKSGESVTASGLPAGLTYAVTETEANQDGYTTTATGAVGAIAESTTSVAAFTNYKSDGGGSSSDPTGNLKITKTVTGGGDTSKEFTFSVTITTSSGTELGTRFSYSGSKSGTIKSGETITLKNGEYITIRSIPSGSKYIVTEEQADGYTTTATGDTGSISGNKTSVAAFINEWSDTSDPTDPTDPTDPADPTDPTAPTDPTDPMNPSVPEQPDTPDPDTPQTGDSSLTGLWMLLCLASLGGLVVMYRRKWFYHGKHIQK